MQSLLGVLFLFIHVILIDQMVMLNYIHQKEISQILMYIQKKTNM